MSLPTSDANALGQIVWTAEGDEPLSPARLVRRIGMTSGATAVLLNRLEKAELVVRSREHMDRRRVTLRPTAMARDRARAFTVASSSEIAAALRGASGEELKIATTVLARMTDAVTQANDRLSENGQGNAVQQSQ